MKTLISLAIILGIFSAYFVFNAEKSISIKGGGNAVPAGVDIARFIFNEELNPSGLTLSDLTQFETIKPKINNILQSELTGEIKSKIGDIKDKILDEAIGLIKKPIENKITETFCPQK